MTAAGILAVPSIRDFFEEAVRSVIDRDLQDAPAPAPATAAYLVDLLCDHATCPLDLKEPLSVLIARARSRALGQRFKHLKRVGDHSLYVAGYFGPSLRRHQLDLDYYRTMGRIAYRRLSRLLATQHQARRLQGVYAELAADFARFVDVLSLVRTETDLAWGNDLAALYEHWLHSRSEGLKRRLQAAGMTFSRARGGRS